jgi:hypothetical protein
MNLTGKTRDAIESALANKTRAELIDVIYQQSKDGQGDSWASVLRIPRDHFEQSFALVQIAMRLFEFAYSNSKVPLEKENLGPEKFLAEARQLIESARAHVLRPQTAVEFLIAKDVTGYPGPNTDALATIFARDKPGVVPFQKLCNPDRKPGDTEPIEGVSWKVYCSKHGFDDLFWKYWRDIREKWERGDQEIGTVPELDIAGKPLLDKNGKPRRINYEPQRYRIILKALAGVPNAWKDYGKDVLKRWKQNGVPLGDFLALAEFRRAHDKRAANLKKPKPKRVLKARTPQRNRSAARRK